MTRAFTEILILVLNIASADTLALIAGPIQKVMNNMDEAAFQNFVKQLHKSLQRSPYQLITGKLGQISTVFEVKRRKSARNMGIIHEAGGNRGSNIGRFWCTPCLLVPVDRASTSGEINRLSSQERVMCRPAPLTHKPHERSGYIYLSSLLWEKRANEEV